ncbi:Ribosome biogenesis protein BRX1 -like protein [Halotydeus destructor]|nr:Ribosome biogenesis protein BRX1 -like protein [Halotydeus destructor]
MGKRKRVIDALNRVEDEEEAVEPAEPELPPGTRFSDDLPAKRVRWINKERVLVFGARGISHRDRHLILNLREMLPHSKQEPKLDPKEPLVAINEICEIRNCSKVLFFENKKRKDLYMWLSNAVTGPSIKFLVENVHTMEELRMAGNCLKGSRPILSFDPSFDKTPEDLLMKEMLTQTFGTPNHHPKSQPFIDHVYTFTLLDHRIWFRNYQIVDDKGTMAEVGPRFALNPIKIFEGSFGGPVIWSSPFYISPNAYRRTLLTEAKDKYRERVGAKVSKEMRQPKGDAYLDNDKYGDVFETIAPEEAKGIMKDVFHR